MLDLEPLLDGSADSEWITDTASSLVTQGGVSMVDLVTRLGPVLIHTNTGVRVAGVGLLSSVLSHEETLARLDTQELDVLFTFYIDRLRDHHSLLPSTLHGVSILTQHPAITTQHLETLLNMLQTEVMVQQQVVRDRSVVFLMMAKMLTDKLATVQQMATLYTLTLVQAGDNETDPRNLLVLFNTKLRLLDCLDVRHHREEIFESLAAYFPVDFTPPSGVLASVTKEQLQLALRSAITHPSLVQWSLELLMEKLDSDLDSAKIDSLETLIELAGKCEEKRESEVVEQWSKQLTSVWSGLKTELMGLRMQSNKTVSKLSAAAVTAVSKLLGSSDHGLRSSDIDQCWDQWWTLVRADTRQGLAQPGTRLLVSSAQVLNSVAASGVRQAGAVLAMVLPVVCGQLGSGEQSRELLAVAGQLLATAAGQHVVMSEPELCGHLDTVFTMFLTSVTTSGDTAGLAAARFAALLSDHQRHELAANIVAGVKQGSQGLGPAVAQLASTHKTLVKTRMLREILSTVTEVSLECVKHVWSVGLYHQTLGPLVQHLTSNQTDTETKVKIVRVLSEHQLSDEDKKSVGGSAPDLIVQLLSQCCPQWPGDHSPAMCALLSQLAQVLTPETWGTVASVVWSAGDSVGVYQASVMTHVCSGTVSTWSADMVSSLMTQDTDHTWRLVASIVNKCPQLVPDSCPDHGVGWLSVGLVKRGDGTGSRWLESLLTQLETRDASVRMVTMLMEPHWWSHATIGLLYKQRLWSQLLPALTRVNSPRHVSALVLSLPHVPSPILNSSLAAVLPRVVTALSSQDTCGPGLTCLETMSSSNPDLLSSYLTEIVHHSLRICQQSPDVRTRVMALSVLAHCSATTGSATSVQLSAMVTRDLRHVLADRKRIVRMEAAKTRNRWFLVTQPS